jgi:HSP20 family molecular chaperone IbpA
MLTPFDFVFEDPFFHTPGFFYPTAHHHHPSYQVSVYEIKEGAMVEVEVPRFRPDEVKVTADFDTGVVTIEGRHPMGAAEQGATHSASQVESFKRYFTVDPTMLDLSKMVTQVNDGLLTIRIPQKPHAPKPEPPKATSIAIAGTPAAITEGPNKDNQVAKADNHLYSHWPPKLEVATKPADGVAVRYDYALPRGVNPENVKVQVLDNGGLRVDVSHSTKREEGNYHEERSASFTRYFQLPAGTKPERVVAKFDNGHLKVEVKDK